MTHFFFKVIFPYIQISRFEHWFKNLLILPGAMLALRFREPGWSWSAAAGDVALALLPICLVSSGNYIINEILDSPFDSHHPSKCHRPLPSGKARPRWAWLLATIHYSVGFAIAGYTLNPELLTYLLLFLLIGGIAYNIPPFRLKEVALLDVLTESANNPIRLLLGWYAMTPAPFPAWVLLISYWAIGAFLMAAKRLSELRHLKDSGMAARYRSSFKYYSEKRLLVMMTGFSFIGLALFGAMLVRYPIRALLPALPFGIVFVLWVFWLVYRDSIFPREPEKVWKEPLFLTYVICSGLIILGLAFPELCR